MQPFNLGPEPFSKINLFLKNDLASLQYCAISSRKQTRKLVTVKKLRDAKNHNSGRLLHEREAETQSHAVHRGPLASS